jgi:hypothetical protein
MSEKQSGNKDDHKDVVYKSYSVGHKTGDNPLLLSVHEIQPRELRHTKFGGLRVTADNDHQDAGGDGVDGVDHGD